ncbi:FliM/FliN family flagellar motor switch protein [Undibacterium sp. Ji49W]|uniref:FliM/FliN family flagellar motor switch protein n=1 Tax=Undibacterium sp. Ji49W TaxID=3413040 RepID=UPI003BF1E121
MSVIEEGGKRVILFDASKAQKLRWWAATELDLIATKFIAINSAWSEKWLIQEQEKSNVSAYLAQNADTSSDKSGAWRKVCASKGRIFWIKIPPRHLESLQEKMFCVNDTHSSSSKLKGKIGKNLALSAWEEYWSKLTDLFPVLDISEMSEIYPEASLFKPWSGAVQLEFNLYGVKFTLVLNQALVEDLLGIDSQHVSDTKKTGKSLFAGRLYSIPEAIAHKKVHVKVELSGCELEIGNLQQMQLGDVIPLAHGLDEPLHVKFANDDELCLAFLGTKSQKKAIEVVAIGYPSKNS